MSEILFQINIPTDDEGYVSLQCHFCGMRFKLEAAEFKDSDIIDL